MKRAIIVLLFTCANAMAFAQVNFVKNPSFEEYFTCPTDINQIGLAKYWTCAVDTLGEPYYAPEWFHRCGVPSIDAGLPNNTYFYQEAHTGNGIVAATFYYDKTLPLPTGVPPNSRDYIQGHLVKPLQNGKTYCVGFWLNVAELAGYGHNKIGAYLDNGNINKRSPAGVEITDVVPQFYTTTIVKDTANWVKVEGSFVASGNETHITIGNFAKNIDVDTAFLYWGALYQYSYYLIDDVSVIPIDLPASAGNDTWVEIGKKVKIGYTKDSATAMGLDCKWYKKGVLIDSGAIITVNANSIINKVDTYVVVQTICGIVKRDTVSVKTTGVGISEYSLSNQFSIYPNPNNGTFNIAMNEAKGTKHSIKVYDLLGRVVHQQVLYFNKNEATLKLNVPSASYIIELQDDEGNVQRERILIE